MPVPDSSADLRLGSLVYWRWGVPLFAVLAMAILWAVQGNVAAFLFLNRQLSVLGVQFWNHLTTLGDANLTLLFLLPLIGRRPQMMWQFFCAAWFAALWVQSMKSPLSVLRPPAVLPPDSFQLIGPMLQHNSFPSGHTTTIFVLVGVLCLQRIGDRYKIGLLLLAVLVGLSRVACGVHWPLDVLGGMLGGWLAALAGVWLGQRWPLGERIGVQRMLAVLSLVLAAWVIGWYDSGHDEARWMQLSLAISLLLLAIPGLRKVFAPQHSASPSPH